MTDELSRLFSIRGKTALVTGGSRGIGRMIAAGLLSCGARTYITARKADVCEATARELGPQGECIALPCDISTTEGIAALVAALEAREDRLDILVNNAGATWGAPFADFPESGWDKVMDLNLKTVFFLTQGLFPLLKRAGRPEDPARVINIASINGLTDSGFDNFSYSAAKAGVIQMTRQLAARLSVADVNVNAIAPGFFPSSMTDHIGSEREDIRRRIPRNRFGEQDDAAGAAVFLAAPASRWITGVTLPVDGGMVAAA